MNVRRTHASRTCVTCKKKKVRCELPDVNVESSPDQPLSASKRCHRCKTLSIDCFVDSKRKSREGERNHSYSRTARNVTPINEIREGASAVVEEEAEGGDPTRFSLFSVESLEANQVVEETADLIVKTPSDAIVEAQRQIFWRCLDLVALPLDLLQRLVNSQIQTSTWKEKIERVELNVDAEDILEVASNQDHHRIQQSLDELLLFAPYLPEAKALRTICQQVENAPSIFLLSTMYLFSIQTTPSDVLSDVKTTLRRIARIQYMLKTRIMMEAPYHSHFIMALDLICTRDPLSESTFLAQIGTTKSQIVSAEHTKKRKRANSDVAHGFARFRKTKGEAMMSKTLCSHLQSFRSISLKRNDPVKETTLRILCQSVELNAMSLLEDYDLVKEKVTAMASLELASSENRHWNLGRIMLKFRFELQNSVSIAKEAFRFSRQNHLHGVLNDQGYSNALDEATQVALAAVEAAKLKWISENREICSDDREEQMHDFVQLEACGYRSRIYNLLYRAIAWPMTKQEIFNPSWQGDPLLHGIEESLQLSLDQLQITTKIIDLITKERDHPLSKLTIKYSTSRNDAAEESLAIFLSMPMKEIGLCPSANICSILVTSVKLLMETQAASMQHFQGVLPRQRTWELLMGQVGERVSAIGRESNHKVGLYSITGEIILQMTAAVQKWKETFKQNGYRSTPKPPATDSPNKLSTAAPALESADYITSLDGMDLDKFWADNTLDAFFADLFCGQEQAYPGSNMPDSL